MKTKRLILICLLLLLLAGAFFADPLVRFSLYLKGERFDRAAEVYLHQLRPSQQVQAEADQILDAYVTDTLAQYYEKTATYDQVAAILTSLSKTQLPQDEIDLALRAIQEMEAARTSFAEANARYAQGDYAGAIPLYRDAYPADDSVPLRLEQALYDYKKQLLAQVTADMDAQAFEKAEAALLASQALLGDDEDLTVALDDVRRMAVAKVYDDQLSQARQLLQTDGPDAAFGYVQGLQLAADDYRLAYLEQLLLHEYEQQICAQAAALRDAGDTEGASACLEAGLNWVDSLQMKTMLSELRSGVRHLLGDMAILLDESGDPLTGSVSTVAIDQVLADARANQYSHSFWVDLGSVHILLENDYSLFTGTVAFPQGEKSNVYRATATLQILGDGVLLAEFTKVNSSFAPAPFSLSVEGVNVLTLSWISDGANGWKDWGRFATIFDGELIPKSVLP